MPLPNEIDALKVYLSIWPGLAGVNIYRSELPDTQAQPLSDAVKNGTAYGAIVIQSTGAGPIDNGTMQISTTTKQVKCYAETPKHARDIWSEVRAALRLLHRNIKYDGIWLYGAAVGAPMELREDAPLNWPLCTSTFDLTASEVT